jgi:hypothetical protein
MEQILIKPLTDLPDGVIGFEVSGEIRPEDFRDVVLTAINRAAEKGKIRLLIVIPEWEGMSGGAMWEDLKAGVNHFTDWKRIALVSDVDWMKNLASVFGWMTPGEVKNFPLSQRDDAIRWVAT